MSCHLLFHNDPPTPHIYTLSLHDALPILSTASIPPTTGLRLTWRRPSAIDRRPGRPARTVGGRDRKSTRLNSSHLGISYAVFCLKKKNSKIYTKEQDGL